MLLISAGFGTRLGFFSGGRRDRDHMVVALTITCAISAYHHWSCAFEPCSW
jgi:hypothetical protein